MNKKKEILIQLCHELEIKYKYYKKEYETDEQHT